MRYSNSFLESNFGDVKENFQTCFFMSLALFVLPLLLVFSMASIFIALFNSVKGIFK